MRKGKYVQLEGIDGSGKSTLISAACAWFAERGLNVLDTVAWTKTNGALPAFEDVRYADVLLTSEPTHGWIGRAIRDEIIRNGAPYDARLTAEAYALDRAVQIMRFVRAFLALDANRWVLQDRSVVSSLAYQSLQSERDGDPVTIEWLASLPGNAMALDYFPDAFVLIDIDANVAQARLNGRMDKRDDARFENTDFQIALSERYREPAVTAAFRSHGTRVHTIDGASTRDEVARQMREILNGLV